MDVEVLVCQVVHCDPVLAKVLSFTAPTGSVDLDLKWPPRLSARDGVKLSARRWPRWLSPTSTRLPPRRRTIALALGPGWRGRVLWPTPRPCARWPPTAGAEAQRPRL